MKGQRIICAALMTALAVGSYSGGYAYAASDTTPVNETQTQEEPATEPQAQLSDEAKEELTEEELAQYYADSVFIGDSIMLGFRNYSAKQKTFVHGIQFLAAGSYSAFNALKPVQGDNVHPMYKGKKYQVWNAVPLIGSKRVFILLGMNDIDILGLEGARDTYKELIDKIVEASPDIEINIISVTYTLQDKGIGKLNNPNIEKYNGMLQEMAEENGWGYVDLCTPVSDGKGNLAKDCCSDEFVHLTTKAYTIWEKELIAYANQQAGQEAEAETEPETQPAAEARTVPGAKAEPETSPAARTALETWMNR